MWNKPINIKTQYLWHVNCVLLFLIVVCILGIDGNNRIFGISQNISEIFVKVLTLVAIPLGLLLLLDAKGRKKLIAAIVVIIYFFWGIAIIW